MSRSNNSLTTHPFSFLNLFHRPAADEVFPLVEIKLMPARRLENFYAGPQFSG